MSRPIALLAGLALLATTAAALDNPALKPRHLLPRDQFLDLCDPAKVFTEHVRVKFRESSRVRLRDGQPVSLEGEDLSPVKAFLARHPELQLIRRWTLSEEEVDAYVAQGEAASGQDLADLNNWYSLELAGGNRDPQGLLKELLALQQVEICHYHPRPAEAACGPDVAPPTPDFTAEQGYRNPAPEGVDIDYAWALDPSHGNGIISYEIQDVEHSWCVGHEDINNNFTVHDTNETEGNHGLAVISIMGACDNGFGITGLVPEASFSGRSWGPDAGTFPDVSNTLFATGTSLDIGEMYLIEIHAPGPSQGTTCTCNCPQFQFIAMEYWPDNFDVIQVNSANGRVCVEAAGNGEMDLDWAGYGGAFNRSLRDSGALLVGAADPGLPHNPSCFTNHGDRVDFYGWGDGVYTAGYGPLFDEDGCTQDYTACFSGTSSATPIVAGAAASLALILRNRDGSFPSPASLRARLSINGTGQGPTDPDKEIGVMPNLRGVLAPDLEPFTPAGWQGALVPSNTYGGTLPATLDAFPTANYLRLNWRNSSLYGDAAASHAKLWRDDVLAANYTVPAAPAGDAGYRNVSNTGMRGGRHYLRMELDPDAEVVEAVEGNNSHVASYCWNPIAVTDGLPVSFARGPKPDPQGAVELAMDGFGNGGDFAGYWEVFGVMGELAGADYDLQLFNQAPTSTTGWTNPVAISQLGTLTDYVGCNNNTASTGDWVGVVNTGDSDSGYTFEGQGSVYKGQVPAITAVMAVDSLVAGEVLDIYEFMVPDLDPIQFNLEITDGSADLAFLIHAASSTFFSRADAALTVDNGAGGESESAIFNPATPGYHALVVAKSRRETLLQSADYTLSWGPVTGDLTHATPAGWSGPLVPRTSGGTVGQLPQLLLPGSTVLDMGYTNLGPGMIEAGHNQRFTVDGITVETSSDLAALGVGANAQRTAVPPGTLKGGRHEIGSILDCNQERHETPPDGEDNNRAYVQHVWSPTSIAAGVPQLRSGAPNHENRENPGYYYMPDNQDGYRFTVSGWTGVAALPDVSNAGTYVHAYDYASSNSTTAFLNPAATSLAPDGWLCMVMYNGHHSGNGQGRNVGVANSQAWPVQPPSGSYTRNP